jgi:Rrf2 family iron-sulfur cluster assembly transcriptional regulator
LIDRRTDYALRTLIYLARDTKGRLFSISRLGKTLRISPVFLAKILQDLSRSGVVDIKRGRNGGVRLKERTATLAKVIKLIDPKFSVGRCIDRRFFCHFKATCPMHRFLVKLDKQIFKKLDSVAISDLISKRR